MIARLKRKPVIIGIISFAAIALVAGFAVPVFAAGLPFHGPRAGGNRNVTVVQGKVASLGSTSITITTSGSTPGSVTLTLDENTNFNIHGNGWLSSASYVGDPVTAIYSNNQTATTPVAAEVSINMPAVAPWTGNTAPTGPGNGSLPFGRGFGRVQGTIAVNGNEITVTSANGTAVGPLSLSANTTVTIHGGTLVLNDSQIIVSTGSSAKAWVSYNNQTEAVNQIMINMPTVAPGTWGAPPAGPRQGNPPSAGAFGMVQGTLTVNGSLITITPAKGTAVGSLTLSANSTVTLHGATLSLSGSTITATAGLSGEVSANYNTQTSEIDQLMIGMPAMTRGPDNAPGNFRGGFGGFGHPPMGR